MPRSCAKQIMQLRVIGRETSHHSDKSNGPWGKDWQPSNAVVKEATPAPVGSRPGGVNKWGIVDLIGNVWEWTSSRVAAYPGNRAVIPTETKDLVSIRGACYVSDPANV